MIADCIDMRLCVISAVVTMFIGLFMPQLGLPLWCIGVMVVYICFHVLIEAVLAVEMNLTKCFPSKKRDYFSIYTQYRRSMWTALKSSAPVILEVKRVFV